MCIIITEIHDTTLLQPFVVVLGAPWPVILEDILKNSRMYKRGVGPRWLSLRATPNPTPHRPQYKGSDVIFMTSLIKTDNRKEYKTVEPVK